MFSQLKEILFGSQAVEYRVILASGKRVTGGFKVSNSMKTDDIYKSVMKVARSAGYRATLGEHLGWSMAPRPGLLDSLIDRALERRPFKR